jgi:hypothetical protein
MQHQPHNSDVKSAIRERNGLRSCLPEVSTWYVSAGCIKHFWVRMDFRHS